MEQSRGAGGAPDQTESPVPALPRQRGAAGPARAGLRERKKAKTRAAIRRCALRLFQAQGYAATTVEQIAEAAEVSSSTFFRYFRTKEDLAFDDDRDPAVIEALLAQPPDVPPLRAFRAAVRSVLSDVPAGERAETREWIELVLREPALRAGFVAQLAGASHDVEAAFARRLGRDGGDPAVRALVGAVVGVMMSLVWHLDDLPGGDIIAAADEALGHLEKGLRL